MMETGNQVHLKLKINNSFESEPSSGSGSSLGDQNDGPMSDEDHIHFPYLMKPNPMKPKDSKELKDSSLTYDDDHDHDDKDQSINEIQYDSKNRKIVFGRPAQSSQESPFEGFGDTASDDSLKEPMNEVVLKCSKKLRKNLDRIETLASAKNIFPKYYDTLVEENSCNAVDMQLSNEPVIKTQSSSNSKSLYLNDSKEPLTFNGKIKSLNDEKKEEETTNNQQGGFSSTGRKVLERHSNVLDVSLNTSQFTESFILKKYSNERSPDLFGDDEDEDDNEENENEAEAEAEAENPQDKEPQTTEADLPDKEKFKTFKGRDMPLIPCSLDNFEEAKEESKVFLDVSNNQSLMCPMENSFADEQTLDNSFQSNSNDPLTLFRNNCRKERELLKRIKKCLSGLPPPPSFTIPQLDMFGAVLDKKEEILNFFETKPEVNPSDSFKTENILFKPSHTLEETKNMGWRDILGVRHHGVSYNLNKASENNEYLSLSVIERFIGAETASSYRNSPSSAKKRITRLKMLTQSPGNRLSHLAKRRAIFSSANLATTSLKSTTSLGPQIVIDKKKVKNKRKATPKRMTPASKKKARKTPSSSARKMLYRCDLVKPGPSRETSKRALFQSPAKQQQQQRVIMPPKPTIKPEIATRVEKSKRALFSPETKPLNSASSSSTSFSSLSAKQFAPKASPQLETFLKRKRNFDEDDEDVTSQTNKLFKGNGENLTPRALKIKSQSFCIGAGSSSIASSTQQSMNNVTFNSNSLGLKHGLSSSQMSLNNGGDNRNSLKLQRAQSDMAAPAHNLTENQRKKLLWAVSQALQEKKINSKHEHFKQYASVLARVVKRIFTEYYQKISTSNSETMLRLAKRYAYNVISGKNVDDIYLQAKLQIDESKRQSMTRVSGYIGPEEYQQRKLSQQMSQTSQNLNGSMQNVFATENSIDSFNVTLSETSSRLCSGSSVSNAELLLTQSQNSFLEHLSQEKQIQMNSSRSAGKLQRKAIVNTNSAQNSSSKSNLGGSALRENVDGEQRRSAQKNFTGKDQRNVSPYTKNNNFNNSLSSGRSLLGSGRKLQAEIVSSGGGKVKRQILFDS